MAEINNEAGSRNQKNLKNRNKNNTFDKNHRSKKFGGGGKVFLNNRREGGQNYFRSRKQNQEIYLSAVVPARDQEKRLPQALKTIGDYFSRQPYGYEIIAVNDGSKDNTATAIEALIGKVAKLKLIDNPVGRGEGRAVCQGMLAGKGKIRIFFDLNDAGAVKEIEKLLPFFKQGFDIAIGGGFWAMADSAAREILPQCKVDGSAFRAEILAWAKKKNFKVKEIIGLRQAGGRGKIQILPVLKAIFDFLRLRLGIIKNGHGKSN